MLASGFNTLPLVLLFRLCFPQPSSGARAEEDRVLTPSRDPAGNSSLEARASATLKRLAPLIAKVDAKHRRTSSYSTPGGSSDGDSSRRQRRSFFGSGTGSSRLFGSQSRGSGSTREEDSDRLLWERVEGLALETEQLRSSRERTASLAAADSRLDEAFLSSLGVSLNGAAGSSATADSSRGGSASPPAFDRERVISLPLGSATEDAAGARAEEDARAARRNQAAATLSAAEFRCWEIREEIERYRRQEEKIRSRVFNGDPLLPLWGEPGGDGE